MGFQCNLLSPPFQVKLSDGVDITEKELLEFVPFVNWATALKASLELQLVEDHPFHQTPYSLQSVTIQSVDRFAKRLGFVKINAIVQTDNGIRNQSLPAITLLRGGYVAILMIVRPSDSKNERWVVVTTQPRIPVGRLQFCEIPIGMLDNNGNFAGVAALEIREETGLQIPTSELIDMTALVSNGSEEEIHGNAHDEELKSVMYPSPDSSDESLSIFLWEKVFDRLEMEDMKTKLAQLCTAELGRRLRSSLSSMRICGKLGLGI